MGYAYGQGFARAAAGKEAPMTVTDPDTPDPLKDPRTTQADPGAYDQGADLASTVDDPASTGEEELATSRTLSDEAGGGDVTGGASSDGPST